MHAVQAVGAVIRGHAARIVPEPAVTHQKAVLVERNPGSRTEVEVPVEPRGWRGIGRPADPIGRHIEVVPDAHKVYGSDLPALDDLCRLTEVRGGTVLCAGLHHAVVTARCLHHLPSLADGVCQRLFNVHILFRLAGEHGDGRVPVVRGRHQHGVYVSLLEQPSEITVGPASGAGPRPGGLRMRLVHVAHGCDVYTRNLAQEISVRSSPSATPNQADIHAIVGAQYPRSGKGRCGYERRTCHPLDKLPPFHPTPPET